MKIISIIISAMMWANLAFAKTQVQHPMTLDLEATGAEYSAYLKSHGLDKLSKHDSIDVAITLGKRNLDWLAYINQSRTDDKKLRLTGQNTRYGIPIDSPRVYNPTIIEGQRADLEKTVPDQMKDVLFNNGAFTDKLSITDDEFVKWSRDVDRVYQIAARYKGLIPYKQEYIQARQNDVRGYYYLSMEKDVGAEIADYSNLGQTDQARLGAYLVNICFNYVGIQSYCDNAFKDAVKNKEVKAFFDKFYGPSKDLWDSFFQIQGTRTDITWDSKNPDTAYIPFQNPPTQALHDFMLNVEDEWHWDKWQLKLDFTDTAAAHLEFEPGVVPHVNDIAGDIITMDANAPIEEYEVQWTIRHEFGHVLGFTDCYVEFYDTDLDAFVSYQLDITNLMCSRAGNLKETHYLEMKKTYYQN